MTNMTKDDWRRLAIQNGDELIAVGVELDLAGIPSRKDLRERVVMALRWGWLARLRYWPEAVAEGYGSIRCFFLGHIWHMKKYKYGGEGKVCRRCHRAIEDLYPDEPNTMSYRDSFADRIRIEWRRLRGLFTRRHEDELPF